MAEAWIPSRRAIRLTTRDRRLVFVCAAVSALVAMVVGVGTSAFGSNAFPDVPSNHAFHDEISSVFYGGIATGYADGRYKPANPVTRGQFAAWTSRSAGRVESLSGSTSMALNQNAQELTFAATEITPGAATSAGLLTGTVTGYFATATPQNCPCRVTLGVRIFQEASGLNEAAYMPATIPNQAAVDDYGVIVTPVTVPFTFDLGQLGWNPDGPPVNFYLLAQRDDANVPTITVNASGWILSVPFDGDAYATSGNGSSGTSGNGSSGTTSGNGSSGTSG